VIAYLKENLFSDFSAIRFINLPAHNRLFHFNKKTHLFKWFISKPVLFIEACQFCMVLKIHHGL